MVLIEVLLYKGIVSNTRGLHEVEIHNESVLRVHLFNRAFRISAGALGDRLQSSN